MSIEADKKLLREYVKSYGLPVKGYLYAYYEGNNWYQVDLAPATAIAEVTRLYADSASHAKNLAAKFWAEDIRNGKLKNIIPTKRTSAKPTRKNNLWQIALFEPHNHVIHFYGGTSRGRIAFTQQRTKGILLRTKAEAKKLAETVPEFYRKKLKFSVAVVPESMTLPQLRKGLGLPSGKA